MSNWCPNSESNWCPIGVQCEKGIKIDLDYDQKRIEQGEKMANVILSFDAGVSLSKCIYEIVETGERRVLLMRPQVMTVPLSTISGYRKMKLGSPRPEAEAWGVVGEKGFIVGTMAYEMLGDEGIGELKYERAVFKILAALGAIKETHSLGTRISLSLTVLLPCGQYSTAARMKSDLELKLRDFEFRGKKLKVKLERFECLPEGSGLYWREDLLSELQAEFPALVEEKVLG